MDLRFRLDRAAARVRRAPFAAVVRAVDARRSAALDALDRERVRVFEVVDGSLTASLSALTL